MTLPAAAAVAAALCRETRQYCSARAALPSCPTGGDDHLTPLMLES
jgi:hypothetical protein